MANHNNFGTGEVGRARRSARAASDWQRRRARSGTPYLGSFVDNLARGIEDADEMAAVAEIEADGEAAGKHRGGGGGNDGRSGGFGLGI